MSEIIAAPTKAEEKVYVQTTLFNLEELEVLSSESVFEKQARLGYSYGEGKGLPLELKFETDLDLNKKGQIVEHHYSVSEFPCAGCSKKIKLILCNNQFKNKKVSLKRWQDRMIDNINQHNKRILICKRCLQGHILIKKTFSIKKCNTSTSI